MAISMEAHVLHLKDTIWMNFKLWPHIWWRVMTIH